MNWALIHKSFCLFSLLLFKFKSLTGETAEYTDSSKQFLWFSYGEKDASIPAECHNSLRPLKTSYSNELVICLCHTIILWSTTLVFVKFVSDFFLITLCWSCFLKSSVEVFVVLDQFSLGDWSFCALTEQWRSIGSFSMRLQNIPP